MLLFAMMLPVAPFPTCIPSVYRYPVTVMLLYIILLFSTLSSVFIPYANLAPVVYMLLYEIVVFVSCGAVIASIVPNADCSESVLFATVILLYVILLFCPPIDNIPWVLAIQLSPSHDMEYDGPNTFIVLLLINTLLAL